MADETEKTEEIQSQADSQAAGTEKEAQGEKESQTEDWEAKYKESQAAHQKAIEERDKANETLDLVYPAVDFSKLQGAEETEEGEKPALTQDDLDRHSQNINNKLLTLDFRQKHPELREYETSLVGPAIARIRSQNPRMTLDKVLDKAAEETNAFLDTEREKGRTEADEKKAKAAAASGLGSASTTSTKKKPEDQGESKKEYFARRRKQNLQGRGLA
jgi:hypothetical protein